MRSVGLALKMVSARVRRVSLPVRTPAKKHARTKGVPQPVRASDVPIEVGDQINREDHLAAVTLRGLIREHDTFASLTNEEVALEVIETLESFTSEERAKLLLACVTDEVRLVRRYEVKKAESRLPKYNFSKGQQQWTNPVHSMIETQILSLCGQMVEIPGVGMKDWGKVTHKDRLARVGLFQGQIDSAKESIEQIVLVDKFLEHEGFETIEDFKKGRGRK